MCTPFCRIAMPMESARALPFFILCVTAFVPISGQEFGNFVPVCVDGEFRESINGLCPDGMDAVIREETCKAITMASGTSVQFDERPMPCHSMPQIAFGCIKYSAGEIRFNPLENVAGTEFKCAEDLVANRSQSTRSTKPSICACTSSAAASIIAVIRGKARYTSVPRSTRDTTTVYSQGTRDGTDTMEKPTTISTSVSASVSTASSKSPSN